MSDAPVTRPDLDTIRARAADAKRNRDSYGKDSRSRRITNEASAEDVPALLAALAAERARADQAASEAIHQYARALEQNQSAENWEWPDFVWDAHQWADALADQTPTAEQES